MSILRGQNIRFQYKNSDVILDNINIEIDSKERVGLVAKSGYGKSTLGKILSGHLLPNSGKVRIDGREIFRKQFHPVQLIYQHPEKSINPKWKIKKAISENGLPDSKIFKVLGIKDSWLERYPNELSGGELQRIAILRSITERTEFLIADEITAMLDAITQAQIWEALIEITQNMNIGLLVITHNKALAERICTRIVYLEEMNQKGKSI